MSVDWGVLHEAAEGKKPPTKDELVQLKEVGKKNVQEISRNGNGNYCPHCHNESLVHGKCHQCKNNDLIGS